MVQPIDAGFGKLFKDRVRSSFDDYMVEHGDDWEDGKIPIGKKRELTTQWVGQVNQPRNIRNTRSLLQAYRHFRDDVKTELSIERFFQKTGCLIAVNGTGLETLNVEGMPADYVNRLPDMTKADSKLREDRVGGEPADKDEDEEEDGEAAEPNSPDDSEEEESDGEKEQAEKEGAIDFFDYHFDTSGDEDDEVPFMSRVKRVAEGGSVTNVHWA